MPLTWKQPTPNRLESTCGRARLEREMTTGGGWRVIIDGRVRQAGATLPEARALAERWLAPDPPDLSQPPARCEGRDFAAWETK